MVTGNHKPLCNPISLPAGKRDTDVGIVNPLPQWLFSRYACSGLSVLFDAKVLSVWPIKIGPGIFNFGQGLGHCLRYGQWIRIGHSKVIVNRPQNRKNAQILKFWGLQKWYFRHPKRKSGTTFINQIPPRDQGKITSGSHFCHSKVFFWPFHLFCIFCPVFRV